MNQDQCIWNILFLFNNEPEQIEIGRIVILFLYNGNKILLKLQKQLHLECNGLCLYLCYNIYILHYAGGRHFFLMSPVISIICSICILKTVNC